jgi:hypothetical protein
LAKNTGSTRRSRKLPAQTCIVTNGCVSFTNFASIFNVEFPISNACKGAETLPSLGLHHTLVFLVPGRRRFHPYLRIPLRNILSRCRDIGSTSKITQPQRLLLRGVSSTILVMEMRTQIFLGLQTPRFIHAGRTE